MSEEMNIEVILDCDGVLADFLSPALARLNKKLGKSITVQEYAIHQKWDIEQVYGISGNEFWRIIEEGDSLWCSIQPFPWARDIIKVCERFGRVTICTTPSYNPICSAQKTQWIMDHLDLKNDSVMIGGRKELMAKKGNYLIDDSPRNIQKFNDAGGKGILVPSNWNTPYLNYSMVIEAISKGINAEI